MRNIQTISQLTELQHQTLVYAAIVALLIFVVAYIVANLIPYRGGDDRSYISRRIGLIVCVVVGGLGFWLRNMLVVSPCIKKAAFQNQFSQTNMICLIITVVGSLVLSFVVMFAFRHTKFGSILGKEKNA